VSESKRAWDDRLHLRDSYNWVDALQNKNARIEDPRTWEKLMLRRLREPRREGVPRTEGCS
jgi:hypothetical protein